MVKIVATLKKSVFLAEVLPFPFYFTLLSDAHSRLTIKKSRKNRHTHANKAFVSNGVKLPLHPGSNKKGRNFKYIIVQVEKKERKK